MTTTKPLISYYGGKQRLARHITPLIPAHYLYAEPFAGGLAVMFKKGLPTDNKCYLEAVNDTDHQLTNMYRVAIREPEKFLNLANSSLLSEIIHTESKNILKNADDYSELERAFAYYFLINNSFIHKLGGGFSFSVDYPIQQVNKWLNKKANLENTLKRIEKVQVFNRDALHFIKMLDRPSTFFYCDPPYINTDCGHFNSYSLQDFNNLIDVLSNVKGNFILSHYDNIAVSVPSDWEVFKINTSMSANNNLSDDKESKKRVEVLYRKISSTPVRLEYQKYMWTPL